MIFGIFESCLYFTFHRKIMVVFFHLISNRSRGHLADICHNAHNVADMYAHRQEMMTVIFAEEKREGRKKSGRCSALPPRGIADDRFERKSVTVDRKSISTESGKFRV